MKEEYSAEMDSKKNKKTSSLESSRHKCVKNPSGPQRWNTRK